MSPFGIVAALWVAVAVPVAVVVGRVLGRRRREEEQAARNAPAEQRPVDDRS
ncbi:hypothetical protein [Pseudonocardia endophytica]|uniref:Uncharacterized protein n=1 Tax=Pseudonocardia endophytica TaxID=401976 RepID=A0A4R1HMN0_PSEEN|nr:hypothetical protein [Pseudonocardia endophytica]TCK20919.1 hypothetical protein EV378_4885 [Pseudonocardia endophytica]